MQQAWGRLGHTIARWGMPGILALLLWLPGFSAAADEAGTPLRDYARDVWTSRNGLPHNTLRDIAQTPDGHLWFATWEGLARYNGLDFTVFDRGSRPRLEDNGIGSLYVDGEGALWLGDSRGSVSRFDQKGRWQHWKPATGEAPVTIIEAMQKDSHGRLWLLYDGMGLGRLDPDRSFHYFLPPPSLRGAVNFTRMVVDAQDRVWVGTFDGLLYLEGDGGLKRAPARFGLPPGLAWPYQAPDGTIWIVAGERIYRMQGEQLVLAHRLPGAGQLTEMLQDRHGDLWLGTENDGLWRLGRRGVEHLQSDSGLLDYRVISLLEDAEGSIWVGMNGGLMRLRETLFTSYTHDNGLSGDFVRTLVEDSRGALWIGSSSGLDRMAPDGRVQPVALRAGARQPSVLAVAAAASGELWVGTRGEGVFRIGAAGQVRHYRPGIDLPHGNYRAVALGDSGQVWLGSGHGVLQLVDGHVVPVAAPGMPQTVVLALAWLEGALWIGTTEGVWRLQDGKAEQVDVAAAGDARSVYGFRQIGTAVWMTSDRGLYRYAGGRLSAVGREQGMPVDTTFELVPDRLGNVWLSSNRGIWRTRLEALEAVAAGRQPRLQGEMYREIDGMVSAQANGSSGPAAILRRDGTVWVATAGGLVSVDPNLLQRFRERAPPPPVMENVLLDGEPLNWRTRDSQVIPGGRRLTLSYVGLSYLLPGRIRYRTRLEGLDHDWIERGSQRSVEYVGLSPGNYVLHVAAAHPDGRWSQDAASWRFTVKPMWWQRLEVRLGAGILVLLVLLLMYRYLIKRYKNSNARLARLVDERTRDLQLQAEHLLAANAEKTGLAERLRQQSEAFERQAREDGLTGLPNRRAFDETLAREVARARRGGHALCLMILDIDHFKRVNDNWSHSVGDDVLCEVGQLLRQACRESDLPARLGGEEFALVLNNTELPEAMVVSERVHALFRDHRDWARRGEDRLQITFSAGLVQMGEQDLTPSLLSQRADRALYQAKHEGRNRTCIG
ncbi:ligand-binding sensor domain-containing diguanylate cyclase [Stenotrophomonas sp. YIM B06876]|uniref:ligand-binding sensor domain-containing diguanylate cyclase n=1 Tax=Stenotrophomonas sp. YIM B06876 TaxID=3060211 RepID=UPI00273A59A7|nr:ligand-binding sensor domain-containing diguanylate cyclase [Stenotrophomonas sp. YIM B06876]